MAETAEKEKKKKILRSWPHQSRGPLRPALNTEGIGGSPEGALSSHSNETSRSRFVPVSEMAGTKHDGAKQQKVEEEMMAERSPLSPPPTSREEDERRGELV